MPKVREPWICPQCGRSLYVRNQEHVCGLYDLEGHFAKRDPIGRLAYEWMCSIFDSLGQYDVLPMKTTIAFVRGSNVAFLKTKRNGAEISLVLSRPLANSRVTGQTAYSRTKNIYRVPVHLASDLDPELEAWLLEVGA